MAFPLSLSQSSFVTPSSPGLKPSPICADWSFGHIPIYLQFASGNSEQPLKSVLLTGTGHNELASSPSAMSVGTFGPARKVMVSSSSRENKTQDNDFLESFDGLPSLGLGFNHDLDYIEPSDSNERLQESTVVQDNSEEDRFIFTGGNGTVGRKSIPPAPRICSSLSRQNSLPVLPNVDSSSLSGLRETHPDRSTPAAGHMDSHCTLSTVLFAPPSPDLLPCNSRNLPSIDSNFEHKQDIHKSPKSAGVGNLLHGLLYRKSMENLHSPHWRMRTTSSVPSSPSSASSVHADINPCPSSPTYSTYCTSLRSSHSASSYESYSTCSSVSSAVPGTLSQEQAQPLKDIIVDIWIDQEGFRAVRPAFRLMGYSRAPISDSGSKIPSSSLDYNKANADLIRADFLPLKRQTFTFHHGALDSAPVLRRMTINGDESRDYISRQASLIIKSNGVYVVRGYETCRSRKGHNDSHEVTLDWLLEYLVEDRRAERTGMIMSGERTFTPLRFSCSPGLLQRSSGHKISVMQVLRKNMAPRMIAEKVEPPKIPAARFMVDGATSKDQECDVCEETSGSQYCLLDSNVDFEDMEGGLQPSGTRRLSSASSSDERLARSLKSDL